MKSMVIVKYLFAIVGLGLLVGAYFAYTSTQNFLQSALTTTGTVTELVRSRSDDSYTYRPVVEFTTRSGEKIEFTSSSGSNPPSYSRGEIVEVFYDQTNPEQAKINGFFSLWGMSLILAGIGTVFSIFGISIIAADHIKSKQVDYLLRNGVPIRAKFNKVEVNNSVKAKGRRPYRIFAQWLDPNTGMMQIFHSDNIWFDPTEHIPSDQITVLIEQNNPKNYHIDLSFLPKVAE